MKKLVINNTLFVFLDVNDFTEFTNRELLEFKNKQLKIYDNCIIYNYFDLREKKQIIKDKIDKIKFINQQRINVRSCVVRNINKEVKNKFLNKYHIQGADKSQILFGVFHDDVLVSVMTFDKSAGMNGGLDEGDFTLSRFAVKSGVIAVGVFNKLLKSFVNTHKPKKIISFGDLNYMLRDNNVYIKNNFKLHHVIKPDYKHYHKGNDKLYHKFTYGNKYMKNINISEYDKKNTKKNLINLWNCGKIKYVLTLDENNKSVFGFIYKITNTVNSKLYIGQTVRLLEKRIYEYKSNFNLGNHNNPHLYNSFNKYGWDCFKFEVIDTAKNIEELNNKEIKYIAQYNSNQKEFGYNIESGGRNSTPSTETLEKMSRSHSDIKQTEEWVNKRVAKAGSDEAKKYGKKKTEEEKKHLAENSPKFWSGKSRSEETKRKISETKLRTGLSEKQKKTLCKIVVRKDISTDEIKIFDSTKIAADYIGKNQSTVSRWCSNKKTIDGFMWIYKEE